MLCWCVIPFSFSSSFPCLVAFFKSARGPFVSRMACVVLLTMRAVLLLVVVVSRKRVYPCSRSGLGDHLPERLFTHPSRLSLSCPSLRLCPSFFPAGFSTRFCFDPILLVCMDLSCLMTPLLLVFFCFCFHAHIKLIKDIRRYMHSYFRPLPAPLLRVGRTPSSAFS